MGKKKEGNEQQRRRAARQARQAGKRPSEVGTTSGASKQRHHLGAHDDSVEKLETIRQGKQQVTDQDVSDPEPRPRSRANTRTTGGSRAEPQIRSRRD